MYEFSQRNWSVSWWLLEPHSWPLCYCERVQEQELVLDPTVQSYSRCMDLDPNRQVIKWQAKTKKTCLKLDVCDN